MSKHETIESRSTGTNGIAPSLYSKLPYDQMKDLAPVTLVARSANLVVVNPSLPAKNIRELVALAKAQPGKMNYASSGVGSTLHLAMELFKSMAGVDIVASEIAKWGKVVRAVGVKID